MAKEGGDKAEVKEKQSRNIKQLLAMAFLVVNAVVMFGSAFLIYKIKFLDKRALITEESLSHEMEEERKAREKMDIRFTFEPFTINLDDKPRKLVNTTIQLEFLDEEGYVELVEKTPKARDEIVRIINGKKFTDIETIQGKLFLKDQIMASMNKILQRGTVKDVYFEDFVVQ
jgi:flagellar FliL protein